MRGRIGIVAILVTLAAAGCSSGGSSNGASGNGLDSNTTVPAAQNAACESAKLTSPEVGVTDKTITVTVIADVQNAFRPGLFKGSWDGVKAWAAYMNAKGGLACRHVVVKTVDSHLTADDSKAALVQACANSLATVGTTALFLSDVRPMTGCKDKAGATTGLPDLALTQTEAGHQCAAVSFAVLPTSSACPYSGSGLRNVQRPQTQYDFYAARYGTDLHAVFAIPKDTPSTIASSMPVFRGLNQLGVKSDAEFGVSGLASQSQYTPIVQAIKQHNSNYALNMIDYKGTVLLRREAAAQGVNNQVKVWDCFLNCYDERLLSEGGSAVENQYVWLSFLPLEDKGSNRELDTFLQYDKTPDAWGVQAWLAAEAFTQAVNDTIAAHNDDPNSITRANILTAIRNLHAFDANGMMPKTDIGAKVASTCYVGLQVQNGKFVRVAPTQPGTFDCDDNKPPITVSLDAAKAFRG